MIEIKDTEVRDGSRVKTLRRYPNNYNDSPEAGAVGTVMKIDAGIGGHAVVKFDHWFAGHEVNRMYHDKFGEGYYWSCKVEDLEVI